MIYLISPTIDNETRKDSNLIYSFESRKCLTLNYEDNISGSLREKSFYQYLIFQI
jgi:hypothetical protein